MIVILTEKNMLASQPIRKLEVSGKLNDYFTEDQILKEDLLLNQLPEGFLPLTPDMISVMVEDYLNEECGRVISTLPLQNLTVFKDYDNEFDKYTLVLCRY